MEGARTKDNCPSGDQCRVRACGDQLTALPRNTSFCPVTEPGLSQSPPRETPALQLGHGELPHQGGGAAGEVQEEEGQGADPQTV